MTTGVYTTTEIALATGFSVRQLNYWDHQGLVKPSIQQSCGPGTRRLYAVDDLIQLQFIHQLKRNGWSIQNVRKAIDTLRAIMNNPDPLKNAVLLHGKSTIIALCKTKEGERILLDALSSSGQQVMGIVLEMLIEEALQIAGRIDDSVSIEEEVR